MSTATQYQFAIRDIVNSIVDEYARKYKPAAGQLGLFEDSAERQKPLFSKNVDDEAGKWVTMRGARVFISNDDGRIMKGPKALMGKTKEQIDREGSAGKEGGGERKPNPKPLNELGRISGGRKENRQGKLFEELNPGFKFVDDGDDEDGDGEEEDFKVVEPVVAPVAAETHSSPADNADPISLLTDDVLHLRPGHRFEQLQQSLGVKKPAMGKQGTKNVQDALRKIPGGNVIAAMLATGSEHGHLVEFDSNGFPQIGNDAFQRAVDGKFSREDLDAAKEFLETNYSNSTEFGNVNQYRWLSGVARVAKPKAAEQSQDEEPSFTLDSTPPKPSPKPTDFGNNSATKQGGLFDTGKKGELKGQELLFNSDAGDLENPKTMENKVKAATSKPMTDEQSINAMAPGAAKRQEFEKKASQDSRSRLAESNKFNETLVKIAADDVSKLRKQDVERVLRSAPDERQGALESWIIKHRPDLAQEVNEVSEEMLQERAAKQDDGPNDGPNDGDTNAEGLVFRDGRWHRDEEEEQSAQDDPSSIPQNGSRFTHEGKEYEVWKTRHGVTEAHPVENGKPVVNRQTTKRFSSDEMSAQRNPELPTLTDEERSRLPEHLKNVTPLFSSEANRLKEMAAKAKASPSPAETKSPASSIQSHLDNDDHQSAFEAFSKLKKDEVDKVAREVLGMGFYNKSKAQMLESLKRTLPLATKTASEAAQKREEIDYAEMKLRKAKENQQAHSEDRLGAPIRSGVPEIAYSDPHGEGRAEVAKAWQAEVDDAQRELDRVSGKQTAEEDGPQDGDVDSTGLVFRNGRWHRDGQEINPSDIAAKASENGENIWSAAKRELGVNSMGEIPPELRKELGDAMAAASAGKAPAPKPPSPGRQKAMEAQEEKKKQDEIEAKPEPEPEKQVEPEPEKQAEKQSKTEAPTREAIKEKAKEVAKKVVSKKMEDFGEYIPGARKEGAKKLGPRAKKEEAAETKKPTWMKPYEVSQIVKSSDKSEEGKWSITSQKQKDWMGQAKQLGSFDTKEEAEKAIPLLAVAQNHRIRKMPDETFAIYRELAKGKYPVVKGGFETENDAKKYMVQNPESIIEHKFPRYESLQYLERVQRDGKDHRKGKDIKPDDFKKDFNLRGGQFGNWQSGKDGQTSLNHAFDSFHDLADTLGLDKGAITLDGKLAMAFGARGTGGENAARAHYEPGERIINLTKMAGAGTLAHEWAHALDHMIAGLTQEKNGSSAVAMQSYSLKKHARPEVAEAVSNLYNTMMAHTEEEAIQAPKTKYSEKMEAEDQERRQKAKEHNLEMAFPRTLDDHMWNVKKNLERMARYKKKDLKPEQVKEFDELAAKIAGGDAGKGVFIEGKGLGSGRVSFENLEKLNEMHKKMVGRGFHTNDDHSLGKNVYHKINSERAVAERVKQAEAGQTEKRKKRTSFLQEAVDLDKQRVGDYYTQPEEMMARAFEGYISDKLEASGRRSDYLIGKGKTNNDRYRAAGIGAPFPEGEERKRINAAFDKLFDTLRGNELKAAAGKKEEPEKYSRTSYNVAASQVAHQIVDRYCRAELVQVDKYAHPLVHAAVGAGAMYLANKAFKGPIRSLAHAAIGAAMAAWMQSAMAANGIPPAQGQQAQPPAAMTPFQKEKAANNAFDSIVQNAIAKHEQRSKAAENAPPSAAQAAADAVVGDAVNDGNSAPQGSAGKEGARAVRPLKDRPDSPGASGGSGSFNSDHPRHPAGSPQSKGGEFAPKGGVESGSGSESSGSSAPEASSSSAESPRNYPDNLNKPASEQTLYQPRVDGISEGSSSGPKKTHDEMILEFRAKNPLGKTEPTKEWFDQQKRQRQKNWKNLVGHLNQNAIDKKTQNKAAKQEAKIQAKKVDFNPSKLEAESSEDQTERQAKKNVIPDIALEHDLDHETLSNAVQDELKMVLPAHQRQEEARQYIAKLGWHAGRINRAEDSYKDHTTMGGINKFASEWAFLYPEIAGQDEHYWMERMWNLSKQGKQDPPSATDEDFVRSVAKRLVDQGYASSFSAGEEGSNDDEDFQPVHGQPGDVDYTPFSRSAVIGLVVDRYMRLAGIG